VWFLSATPLFNRVTDLCGYVVLLWRKAEQPTTDAEGDGEEDGDGDVLMTEDEDALTPYVRAEQTGEANITLLDPRRLATIIRRGDRKEHTGGSPDWLPGAPACAPADCLVLIDGRYDRGGR
jgi:hypothetical protein